MWRPITVGPTLRARESSWMILAAALLLVLAMDGWISRVDGLILLASYYPYFRGTLEDARRQRQEMPPAPADAPRPALDIMVFLAGLGMIVLRVGWIVTRHGSTKSFGMSDLLMA